TLKKDFVILCRIYKYAYSLFFLRIISFQKGSVSMVEWLKKSSFFIGIGIFIIVFLFLTREKEEIYQADLTPVTTTSNNRNVEENQDEAVVLVDIKGEVSQPGVYELDSEARVKDVVELASGCTGKADESLINLAQKVHDEMIRVVHAEDEADFIGNGEASSVDSSVEKVRINYATQEEIETLSGIGPSKAATIIQYREENGLFQTIDDLLEVSGIGEKTLENIRDQIQIP